MGLIGTGNGDDRPRSLKVPPTLFAGRVRLRYLGDSASCLPPCFNWILPTMTDLSKIYTWYEPSFLLISTFHAPLWFFFFGGKFPLGFLETCTGCFSLEKTLDYGLFSRWSFSADRESLIRALALVADNRFCSAEENWLFLGLSGVLWSGSGQTTVGMVSTDDGFLSSHSSTDPIAHFLFVFVDSCLLACFSSVSAG